MKISLEYSEIQEDIFFNWPNHLRFKIITKGRRAGLTKGAANAFIEKLINGEGPLLWGDTINGNITRYFDRYFLPELKKNKIAWHFDRQNKQLTINGNTCDFRSADQPENWEGFGYKLIFLNEAGIILKNKSLYADTVLPMLMDYPDAKMIAGGVPKGKKTRNGEEHIFYTLYKRAMSGESQYQHINTTAYNNPWLTKDVIAQLEKEQEVIGGKARVEQEIYGLFIDKSTDNPFATQFDQDKHVKACGLDLNKHLYLSLDFNLNPFAMIAGHHWRDNAGYHAHICEETEIKNGSIPLLIETIRGKYGKWLHKMTITGDYSGHKKEQALEDNASHYLQIQRGLRLRESQIFTPVNPKHKNSRADLNYTLYHHPDYRIDPSCKNLIFDMNNVEYDSIKEEIIKLNRNEAAQKADFIDAKRYFDNAFLHDWRVWHQKHGK